MNLNELFRIQRELDEAIVKKKGLEGKNLLQERILALQVELGECANEWRGFKFWSKDQEPRTSAEILCRTCAGTGYDRYDLPNGRFDYDTPCPTCYGTRKEIRNLLLEEYVDCLHFILSIGLELNMPIVNIWIDSDYTEEDTTATFNKLFSCISEIVETADYGEHVDLVEIYEITFNLFVGLGEKLLGFSWDEIEAAYLVKNEVNHARQETGY